MFDHVCMFSTASLIPSHAHRFFLFTFWFRFPRLKTFHLFAPETLDPQRKSEGNLPQRLVWTLVATPGILLNHFGGFQWTSLKKVTSWWRIHCRLQLMPPNFVLHAESYWPTVFTRHIFEFSLQHFFFSFFAFLGFSDAFLFCTYTS